MFPDKINDQLVDQVTRDTNTKDNSHHIIENESKKVFLFLKKSKNIYFLIFIGYETFSILSCSNRDTSPQDLSIMTLLRVQPVY